jgi:FlaA1/EpsC-like NDP-sugar epimerase
MFRMSGRAISLVLVETGLLSGAVVLATYIRLGAGGWPFIAGIDGAMHVLLIVAVCQVCLHYADLYDLSTIADVRELLVRLFQALGATSLILAFIYFWFPDWIIGRGVFLVASALALSLVVGWRLGFVWLAKRVGPRERLLLVGTNPAAVELAR